MISPLGNNFTSLKYEDQEINKVYFEDKIVYQKPKYTPVTAIVASNKEQWVDTGLGKGWWTDGIEFETKVMFSEHSASVFGQRGAEKTFDYDINMESNSNLSLRSRNNSDDSLRVPIKGFNIPLSITYHLGTTYYVNDLLGTPYNWKDETRTFVLQSTFHLFRINQYLGTSEGSGGFNDNGTRTIYYFRMWYGGKKAIDYIPVLDENEIPCFFDKVTQKFIYSAGPKPLEYIL